MSRSPRIKRRRKVKRNFTKYTIRKAFPYLIEDFKSRCAYSMLHVERTGDTAMHIDHFDPRLKPNYQQDYSNLYLASEGCNKAKGNNWPTKADQKLGVRFLDPCAEQDYGVHIFEDPQTHHLIGTSAAGVWQIEICNLNANHLVIERRERATCRKF